MAAIRPMCRDDLPACVGLSRSAGWNQSPSDWSRFLDLGGAGCFVAEDASGGAIGSVTTCRFGPVGWISMLLVEPSRRAQGIGRRLFARAMASLRDAGVRSLRLDATPLGRPLYESLGFRVDFELARFAGTLPEREAGESSFLVEIPRDVPAVARLDRDVTRTDRAPLIGRLMADAPASARLARMASGEPSGYVLWRDGANAAQIGPCGATPDAGETLLDAAAAALAGRAVIADIPLAHDRALAWAEGRGLTPVRPFWRMTCGDPVRENVPSLWASSGAELG